MFSLGGIIVGTVRFVVINKLVYFKPRLKQHLIEKAASRRVPLSLRRPHCSTRRVPDAQQDSSHCGRLTYSSFIFFHLAMKLRSDGH